MGEPARQPDLFLAPPKLAEPKRLSPAPVGARPAHRNLADEALRRIEEHPDVAQLMLKFARQLAAKGRPFGVALIWERVRWEYALEGRDSPRLNNSYRSYFARWMVAEDPSLESYIEFRAVTYRESERTA